MKEMLRAAVGSLIAFTVLTGVVYPVVVGGVATLIAPDHRDLIGQPFTDPAYFWGRPSAAGYNATASTGTNDGPNATLHDAVAARITALRAADPGNTAPVPIDLVTSSASGLDPHISPEAAYYQAGRVARVRGIDERAVRALVASQIEGRTFAVLGQPRVNVVVLDRALDAQTGTRSAGR